MGLDVPDGYDLMDWKGRQMFSDREHGIVSGLSPINMTNGGNVSYPSYLTGGQITGGQTPLMPMELFNEGDQDINMALNSMVGTTSPSIGQLEGTEEISIRREPMGEEPRTMDMKEKYKNILRQYASQLSETGEEIGRLWQQVKKVEVAYANELKEAGQEITAENQLITDEFLQELEVLFSSAIPAMQTGAIVKDSESAMLERVEAAKEIEELGIQLPLNRWIEIRKDPTAKQKIINIFSLMTAQQQQGTQAQTALMDRISNIVGKREGLAGTMAGAATTQAEQIKEIFGKRLSPEQIRAIGTAAGGAAATKQGGFRGFVTQYNAAKGAEAAARDLVYQDMIKNYPESQTAAESAAMADILQKEITREQSLVTAGLRGTTSSNKATAAAKDFMLLGKDPDITGGDLFKAGMKLADSEGYNPEDHQSIAIVFMLQAGRHDVVNQTFPIYKGKREVTIDGKLGTATLMEYIQARQKDLGADLYANATQIINEWLRGSIVE